MENTKYSVTLADGTVLKNLTLNGNNFVSAKEIDASVFAGNCAHVVINDGETEEVHENMELVQLTQMGSEYWFILRDLSAQEIAFNKIKSDIDFLAMMSDVEL